MVSWRKRAPRVVGLREASDNLPACVQAALTRPPRIDRKLSPSELRSRVEETPATASFSGVFTGIQLLKATYARHRNCGSHRISRMSWRCSSSRFSAKNAAMRRWMPGEPGPTSSNLLCSSPLPPRPQMAGASPGWGKTAMDITNHHALLRCAPPVPAPRGRGQGFARCASERIPWPPRDRLK